MTDEPLTPAGGRFLPNGDFRAAHHLPGHRILVRVYGFRGPEWWMPRRKCLVDSYVLDCHPCCGVPKDIGHAHACRQAATPPTS